MLARSRGRAAGFAAILALGVLACSNGPDVTPSPSVASAAPVSGCVHGAATPAPGATQQPSPACTTLTSSSPLGSGSVGASVPESGGLSGSPAPSIAPSPSFFVYTVIAGDSLLGIARRYHTTGRSIAYWNRDTYPSLDPESKNYSPNRIEVGWKLKLIPNVTFDGQTASSSASPTAIPIPIPSGSRPPPPTQPADGSAVLLSNGPRSLPYVALTFDLGGDLVPTLDVINWLIDNDVPATMFVEGQTISTTDAGRKALTLIAAHPDLFTIANYSWDGLSYTDLTDDQIRQELSLAEQAIQLTTGRSTKPFFRPPLGSQDGHVRLTAGAEGYKYMVMWDVDTLDAKSPSEGGPTATDIVAKVVSRAVGGSIVQLHVGGYNTLEALPGIVDGLRSRGLLPVSLATMFGF